MEGKKSWLRAELFQQTMSRVRHHATKDPANATYMKGRHKKETSRELFPQTNVILFAGLLRGQPHRVSTRKRDSFIQQVW